MALAMRCDVGFEMFAYVGRKMRLCALALYRLIFSATWDLTFLQVVATKGCLCGCLHFTYNHCSIRIIVVMTRKSTT